MSQPARSEKPRSLYGDAWRRLLENRMAVFCGIVVTLQAILVMLSMFIAPFEADQQELWIQAQPPGFTHPDVQAEMLFEIGAPANLPAQATKAAREPEGLVFVANRAVNREIRVTVADGLITEMVIDGRSPLDVIEVGPETGSTDYLEIIFETPGETLIVPAGRLALKEPAPSWLPPTPGRRRWSVILNLSTPLPARIEVATDDSGNVTRLSEDGASKQELRLRGHEVVELLAGDRKLTHTHRLGTDARGRDLYSRILWGGWISLTVGIIATLVSLAIGVIYGAISGYFGGKIDTFMMAVVDILYAVPYMFLVILLLVTFGRSLVMLFVALGCVQWLTMARIVRGQVLSLKEKEFIEAARVCGARHHSILLRHLIPNTLGIVVIYTTLTIPTVILQEAFLAFIGLSVEYKGKAIESWGSMVNGGRLMLGENGQNWWLLVFPALSLAIMLFSLNFLGDGLRDAFDPKQKGKK